MIEAARRVAASTYVDWQAAVAARDATVRYASEHKCDPGAHYWQEEFQARLKHEAAMAVLGVLIDAEKG